MLILNLCSEILILFYPEVKPLDYALHITCEVLRCWVLFCISIVVLTENVVRDLCCNVLQGPNHTHSGDGHNKLMEFMNCTFPLAVYGLQDVYSGYILYLKLWTSNSDPKIIGRWYLQHLYESKGEICALVNVNLSLLSPNPFFPSPVHTHFPPQPDLWAQWNWEVIIRNSHLTTAILTIRNKHFPC